MSDVESRAFEPADLQFFGEITAGISHEVKNVVTIINESAGLLNDLSVGAESGRRPLDPARIKKMSTDIARNVDRAVAIINRMNRFAHSVDEPRKQVDLAAVVADAVALASRFASVRGVDLNAEIPGDPLLIHSYVFGLHRALHTALQIAVLDCQGSRPVRIAVMANANTATVAVARGPVNQTTAFEDRFRALGRIADAIGGTLSNLSENPGVEELTLSFPIKD
jgi:signal transduction histidine kinase